MKSLTNKSQDTCLDCLSGAKRPTSYRFRPVETLVFSFGCASAPYMGAKGLKSPPQHGHAAIFEPATQDSAGKPIITCLYLTLSGFQSHFSTFSLKFHKNSHPAPSMPQGGRFEIFFQSGSLAAWQIKFLSLLQILVFYGFSVHGVYQGPP